MVGGAVDIVGGRGACRRVASHRCIVSTWWCVVAACLLWLLLICSSNFYTTGLAAVPTPAGLHVAAEWLGALLVHLSNDVTPYTAFSVLAHQSDGAADTGYKHAVPVVPAFARAIAAELLAAIDQPGAVCCCQSHRYHDIITGPFVEPPSDDGAIHSASHPRSAADHIDDQVLCRALQALCDLVSNDVDKQRWLHSAGVLPLAQRLLQRGGVGVGAGQLPDGCPSVQTARALAMLSAEPTVAVRGWLPQAVLTVLCTPCLSTGGHLQDGVAGMAAGGPHERRLPTAELLHGGVAAHPGSCCNKQRPGHRRA